jgi:cell division protein FtsL
MTPPPAATAAARTVAIPGAPSRTRRPQAPRIPRRVSGPAPAPKRAPRPHLPLPRPKAVPRRPGHAGDRPLGRRVFEWVAALPDHALVDRAIRGRLWIGVIGILLFGLVAVQVTLLKLNAGIGSAVEQTAALERSNGELRAQVSKLSSGERIQAKAGQIGMVLPPAGEIHFVRPGKGDAAAAATALKDGKFGSDAQAGAGTAPPADATAQTTDATPTDPSQNAGAGTTTAAAGTNGSTDPLNDGDPSNDYLYDGDPTNDNPAASAASTSDPLHDGDPSNDYLYDGDPTNDGGPGQ